MLDGLRQFTLKHICTDILHSVTAAKVNNSVHNEDKGNRKSAVS